MKELLTLTINGAAIHGDLIVPKDPLGLIIFSHGSGSSRFSPRNNFVALQLQQAGFATFLLDLLTKEEDYIYNNRFNIELLSQRLVEVTRQLVHTPAASGLPIGYFGASTGAAAAIAAAATLGNQISAVVSRGGRPDLVPNDLPRVKAPVLLIVGSLDEQVMELNELALEEIRASKNLTTAKGASHLFEEPGTLEQVATLARDWFLKYMKQPAGIPSGAPDKVKIKKTTHRAISGPMGKFSSKRSTMQ